MIKEIYITDYNCVTPLGFDIESNWKALVEGKSGVALHQVSDNLEAFFVSKIDSEKLEEEFKRFFDNQDFTRLEKTFLLSLKPLVEKHHISDDTAFILSTTKGKRGNGKPVLCYKQVCASKKEHFKTLPQFAVS